MYPIALDVSRLRIMLVGDGEATVKRLAALDQDGAVMVSVFSNAPSSSLQEKAGDRLQKRYPTEADFAGMQLVMIADPEEQQKGALAEIACSKGILVNVEDRKQYCDFHFNSFIRRGDLLIAITTGGKSPTIARKFKEFLAQEIGPEWEARLDEIAIEREKWKQENISFEELKRRSEAYLEEKGWLQELYD